MSRFGITRVSFQHPCGIPHELVESPADNRQPIVNEAQGIGPQWSPTASPTLQSGVGLRAAFLQRAEKRALPITPIRPRLPLAIAEGVPAA